MHYLNGYMIILYMSHIIDKQPWDSAISHSGEHKLQKIKMQWFMPFCSYDRLFWLKCSWFTKISWDSSH
jgi:hypothetical protein